MTICQVAPTRGAGIQANHGGSDKGEVRVKRVSWEKWGKSRPHFQLIHGARMNWLREVRSQLRSLPTLVLIVAPFFYGKSWLFRGVEDICVKHTKGTSRTVRREELGGASPYRQMDYRKIFFGSDPQFATVIMPLSWPAPEWGSPAKAFEVEQPTAENFWRKPDIVSEMTSSFPIEQFIHDAHELDDRDMALGLELAPVHLYDWLAFLEMIVPDLGLLKDRIRIISLESEPATILRHARARWEADRESDPEGIIYRARLLEAFATPAYPLPEGYSAVVLHNNSDEDTRLIDKARQFILS